jgi:G:T-mismatch repair DNA endonuclease (very short patch repair protein)
MYGREEYFLAKFSRKISRKKRQLENLSEEGVHG